MEKGRSPRFRPLIRSDLDACRPAAVVRFFVTRAGVFGLCACLSLVMACAAQLDSGLVQEALDEASLATQAASEGNADVLAAGRYAQATSVLDHAIELQRDGDLWGSYYLARRAGAWAELATAEAAESTATAELNRAHQEYIETRLEEAGLRETAATTRQRAASVERDQALGRAREAARLSERAQATAKKAESDAADTVTRARAELAIENARFLLGLAREAGAPSEAADAYSAAVALADEADEVLMSGDFGLARLKAGEAYTAASEARLSALRDRAVRSTAGDETRVRNAIASSRSVGGARALLQLAEEAGAARRTPDEYQAARLRLERAESLLAAESYEEAVVAGHEAARLAADVQAEAAAALAGVLSQRRIEERIASVRDKVLSVARELAQLDELARTVSSQQLESVDGLIRMARRLLDERDVDLAEVNADRAMQLVEQAREYLQGATAAEEQLIRSGAGVDGVQAFRTGRGAVLRVGGDLFPVGRSDLSSASDPLIERIAAALQPYASGFGVVVEGHTDRSGNAETNLRLSRERSEALAARLRQLLGPDVAVSSTGYGDRQLLSGIEPDDARNRRIEVILLTRERP